MVDGTTDGRAAPARGSRRRPRQDRPITRELVRDALAYISPSIGHEERARVAFAVFDGLGEQGGDLWLDWAAQRTGADLAGDRSTWKSCCKPGPIKVGTLFGMAQDGGFQFPKDDEDRPPPDAAALAAEKARRDAEHARFEAEARQRADQAARDAREIWGEALRDRVAERSPYLQRKRVGAYGLRVMNDGTLLVPMRDAEDDTLQNLQRIAPKKPEGDQPEKRFLPGGRKKGLCHLIDGAGVCTRDGEPVPVLLLAEGYATAATVHEAVSRPAAVCFDAGQLRNVAVALHARWPEALLVVCGDDDWETEARTGTNAGRKGAMQAVRAVQAAGGRAFAAFPVMQGLPGASDWNDLAHAQSLGAVQMHLLAMIDEQLTAIRMELAAAAEPASDFEADCAAKIDEAAPVPAAWSAELDEEIDRLVEAGLQALAESSSPPPSPEQRPRAHREGGGGRAQTGEGEDSARERARKIREVADGLQERFALIYGSDTCWDGQIEKIIRVQAMRLAFGREPVNLWLARPQRRMVMPDDLLFEPGAEVLPHQINMFSGLELEPQACTADEVRPMLDLLRHLCSETSASADDVDAVMHQVLCWQALPLQRLGAKMQFALVFHGAQGTGKNLYFDAWRDLFGAHGITVGQVELEDKFNGWISRKLAIIGDEVVSRQEMYHNKNRLKLVVTQADKFPIRGMQQETRWESNHANVVFLSNESQPLALEERDRRYLVVYTPLEADAAVYQAVRDFRAAGGLRKWLHYLQQYPLDDFSEHSKPLMTQAKVDLIELGWRPPERFVHEWLGGYLELPLRVCSAEQLYRAFRRWCDQTGEKWPPAQAIFSRQVDRWVRERVQRDPVTQRFAEPALAYKQIALKDEHQARKTVRCWVPKGAGPLPGISEGEWAYDSCKAFERDLGRYCRRFGAGDDEAGEGAAP